MTMRQVCAALRRWVERLRVAFWLHEREFDGGRRAVLFGAAAVAGSLVLAQVPVTGSLVDYGCAGFRTPAFPGPYGDEMMAVIRSAFLPRMYDQLYKAAPVLAALLDNG